jgi:hypothetical protein
MKHGCDSSERVRLPGCLPTPDKYDNYWLTLGSGRVEGPCILSSGRKGSKWFASLGNARGVLFDENYKLRYFDTPEDALRALRSAC